MHEHIFILTPDVQQNTGEFNEEEEIISAVERLNELKQAGIDSICDPTVIGLGRYIPRIARVANSTELNIVVATGLYTYTDVPHYFKYRNHRTSASGADPLTDLFVRDITEGIRETTIRAGFLKCATDAPGLTPGVERVLRAVARASTQTSCPILTHTDPHTRRGLDQIVVFKDEGVDLSRVVIGHSGDVDDRPYLMELLEEGVILGMDRFGMDRLFPFERRVKIVADLCREGFSSQLVLSHDASCYMDWFDKPVRQSLFPNWNYLHISKDVLPALRALGVSENDITTMLVDNPRRFLGF